MKRLKKMMALVIAMVMVLGMMSLSAFAADPTYSITVTNTSDTITIAGKTYSAYKLFDMTYTSDNTAYSYSIDSDGDGAWAWSTLTNGLTADANGVYTNATYGIKFVPSAADATVYSVQLVDTAGKYPGDTGYNSESLVYTGEKARALADALESVKPSTNNGSVTIAAGSETGTINTNPNAAGYYLVYGTAEPKEDINSNTEVVAAVALTSTDPTATVNPKASVPPLEKEITAVTETDNTVVSGAVLDEDGQAAVAKVGSKVSYKLTSVVPDMRGYTSYEFFMTDTMTSGLTFDSSSVKVYIYKTETVDDSETTTYLTANTPATSTTKAVYQNTTLATENIDGATFKLTFDNFIKLADYTGYTIEVTYDATVNNNALTYDYENNTANLTYSNNPYDQSKKNTTPDEKTYVIDLNIDVDKIGNGDNTKKLDGAEFKLYKTTTGAATYTVASEYDPSATYYSDNDGTDTVVTVADADAFATAGTLYTKTAGTSSKQYYKWDNNKVTWVATQAAGDTFTTDSTGKLTQQVRGLDKGEYYLEETKAPKGYNPLSAPVKVTISVSEADNKVTYSATTDGVSAAVTNGTVDLAAAQTQAQPVATATINNQSGTELPSTGGIGTTIFYVVGAILVIGAGVILITRRRMDA